MDPVVKIPSEDLEKIEDILASRDTELYRAYEIVSAYLDESDG